MLQVIGQFIDEIVQVFNHSQNQGLSTKQGGTANDYLVVVIEITSSAMPRYSSSPSMKDR